MRPASNEEQPAVMSIAGERFTIDFSDDENTQPADSTTRSRHGPAAPMSLAFVGDIVEREPAAAKPPSLPTPKSMSTGFPEHKKRTKISAFKQQRTSATKQGRFPAAPQHTKTSQAGTTSTSTDDGKFEDIERRNIDQENRRRIEAMSEREIIEERQELLSRFGPSLIQSLLRRANLDDDRGDTGIETDPESAKIDEINKPATISAEDANATPIPQPKAKRLTAARTVTLDEDAGPKDIGQLQPVSLFNREALTAAVAAATPNVHFPHAPTAPELDPSDPSFLENLHAKYFPNLPADPSKMAWMAPIPTHGSTADQESPYYPAQQALAASALRFDFRGGLLPPRIARAVPVTKGLHHHGEAPEAAGYTIPELARLARSAFPAQRCLAYQILGRFLYRLGRGEWGDESSEIAKGLWGCVKDGKVIETLEEASSAEGGHQGSKAYGIEAVWLWQKGGGQVWKAS